MKRQGREAIEKRRPELIKALESMGNFYMELRWDFTSWIPLLSRILPSDICKIYKKGANIRLDTTLVDFNDMKWERGDVSFLFTGKGSPVRNGITRTLSDGTSSSKNSSHSLVVMDNRMKVYQRVKQDETEHEIDDEVDVLMSSDIVSAQLNTKSMCFTRISSGWFFKTDKSERVGPFMSDFYLISGFTIESRKRREHLTEEDLQKNRAVIESLTRHPPANGSLITNGSQHSVTHSGDHVAHHSELPCPRRPSLMPPENSHRVTWNEYISSPEGCHPPLGRPQVAKMSSKSFKATLAMSQDFPMTTDSLLSVLEIVAPFKQFKKLREFVQMKLPPGFPVKIGQFHELHMFVILLMVSLFV
jgi:hypothetical protein